MVGVGGGGSWRDGLLRDGTGGLEGWAAEGWDWTWWGWGGWRDGLLRDGTGHGGGGGAGGMGC